MLNKNYIYLEHIYPKLDIKMIGGCFWLLQLDDIWIFPNLINQSTTCPQFFIEEHFVRTVTILKLGLYLDWTLIQA